MAAVLGQCNHWWRVEPINGLPHWRRAAWSELHKWIVNPPAPRAVLLSGARQIGKTTLLLQSIAERLASGVPPANIPHPTFDHPLFKLAGIDAVFDVWRQREPAAPGPAYLFLAEGSRVGRWHAIRLTTLSFYEHLQIKKLQLPKLHARPTLRRTLP